MGRLILNRINFTDVNVEKVSVVLKTSRTGGSRGVWPLLQQSTQRTWWTGLSSSFASIPPGCGTESRAAQTTSHDNSHDASQQVMTTCASESSNTLKGILSFFGVTAPADPTANASAIDGTPESCDQRQPERAVCDLSCALYLADITALGISISEWKADRFDIGKA
ncbi:hypothetical protein QQF64_025533 [Cirrhinus molitorella]|uniref:Uncharacterized protein n=1 Tax=Cirrhinus molitorella TaxID=172907 RepID=A0ABR3NQR2_9TELE